MKETILIQVDSKKTGFELYSKLKKFIEDNEFSITYENRKKLEIRTKYCTVKIRPNDPYMMYNADLYDTIYGLNNTDLKYTDNLFNNIIDIETKRSTLKGKIFNRTTLKIAIIIFFTIIYIIPFMLLGVKNGQANELPSAEPTAIKTIQVSASVSNDETTSFPMEESESSRYFDIPLDDKLQDYIFKLCDEHKIEPSIVIGMIEMESNFDASAVGDNGESFGLMQIQPRWHQERMKKLKCDDLLDPYQNVAVGIDYLADLYSTGKQTEWVLMAYNGGASYANDSMNEGVISEYAETVLMNSKNLTTRDSNT